MLEIIDTLDRYCEQIVSLVTLGQIDAIREMYESWYSTAGHIEPNALGYAFAAFVVIVRFIVPVVLFYYLVVRNVFRNIYLRIAVTSVFIVVYAMFYFDPISVFEEASVSVTRFYYFLKALPSIETEPVLFTFLTNGLAVFVLRALVVFVGVWALFFAIVFLVSAIFWVVTAGKSIWSFTDKNLKAFTLQMTIVFLLFYPIVGAFRAFMTVLAVVIGMINVKDAIYTIRGYQKVCYSVGDEVRCKWAR